MTFFRTVICCLLIISWCGVAAVFGAGAPLSDATQECLECHASFHPGITEDWQRSRHAAVTPAEAMAVDGLSRKVSAETVPEDLKGVAVGCAECHLLRPDAHADTFEHNGYQVHVVVSPDDCKTCHRVEADQYSQNIMAHARKNLADNVVYNQLQRSILGRPAVGKEGLTIAPESEATRAEACYYCHGTELKTTGTEVRDTDAGELEFPVIEGWPNQGVGRVNLDGSLGACSACHTRHGFSIEMARKPHTCSECHIGPDVPAYKVYTASKHGNIYSAMNEQWDFTAVPWTVGKDFKAPTCATCHVSLLVDTDEAVVAERTHEMKNRLSWRIFGLVYAHPQPKSPDTTIIRNRNGRPLPTDLEGGFATDYLITAEEQEERTAVMQAVCLKCHDSSWVTGHFERYHNTIEASNQSIRAATDLMQIGWKDGLAKGFDQGESPFDESLERLWSDTWLFYGNTVRFASAMAGGGDYGVFANGRYQLSSSVIELKHRIDLERRLPPPSP
ncbi:MAG: multiheme c-type cytochrome [Desulfobacterales bacterium]